MARVAAEGLQWLSKPSTGYDLFTKPTLFKSTCTDTEPQISPKRLAATRGSELFFGCGNEVRCADLQDLKARHPDIAVVAEGAKKVGHREHKVLNLPKLDFEICQLDISHDDLYLAIVGEKELAVCVLPGEGFLKRDAPRPTVPHFHRVGRGYHSQDDGANIVRVLWHPLGVEGASLVVLTADGFVRTYDFTIGSELSFEVPDQVLDLFALAGRKRHTGGFTADEDEMTPASCCFGSGIQGWRLFTLYVLMRGGDIYALVPLVPSRWMASTDCLQRLSLDITAEVENLDDQTPSEYRAVLRQQTKWINDVLNQEANIADAQSSFSTPRGNVPTCLNRPDIVGPSPILQGPFLFDPAPVESVIDDCPAACDIFHIEADPVGVIAILYSHGRVDICLEYDTLVAKWVDKRKPKTKASDAPLDLPVISSYETIDLEIQAGSSSEYTSWPVFTKDPNTSHLWFVNHISGIVAFSMKGWLNKLESILDEYEEDGSLAALLEKSPRSQVQTIVNTVKKSVNGCAVVYEAYIGYILVACYSGGVSSVEFDEPRGSAILPEDDETDTITLQPSTQRYNIMDSILKPRATRYHTPESSFLTPKPANLQQQQPTLPPPIVKVSILQPPYQPSPEFTKKSTLPQILREAKSHHPKLMSNKMVFSSETFDILTHARHTLKTEFDQLMEGAQEMHDRVAAQRLEYNKQLETLHNVHQRLRDLQGRGVGDRLERFIERQLEMQQRADKLLKRLIVESEMGLSDAEKKWVREVERMSERMVGDGKHTFGKRTLDVGKLVKELMPVADNGEAEDTGDGNGGEGSSIEGSVRDGVPKAVREGQLKLLQNLLEREDKLVTSTRKRLESLTIETERL